MRAYRGVDAPPDELVDPIDDAHSCLLPGHGSPPTGGPAWPSARANRSQALTVRRRSPALPISMTNRAIRLPTIKYTSAAMPQLIAIASLWLCGLNMPSKGPTSDRAASWTLETIELDGFALKTISRMPATMIAARI